MATLRVSGSDKVLEISRSELETWLNSNPEMEKIVPDQERERVDRTYLAPMVAGYASAIPAVSDWVAPRPEFGVTT